MGAQMIRNCLNIVFFLTSGKGELGQTHAEAGCVEVLLPVPQSSCVALQD